MFRWVEHTAELELEIESPTEEGVLEEALSALAELLAGDQRTGPSERRGVSAKASDRPALLAAWLEELVFLAESEGFEPLAVESLELGKGFVTATVRGQAGAPPPLVKAVTYHRLQFEPTEAGYLARAVLDV